MLLTPCIEWLWCRDRCGYGVLQYEGKLRKAHRVAYCLFHNVTLDSITSVEIRHKCDNPGCCEPTHLEEGTRQDNEDDKTLRGRRPVGAEYNVSTLSDEDILQIRSQYVRRSREFGSRGLSKKFNVHDSTIRLIVENKTWRHLCQ